MTMFPLVTFEKLTTKMRSMVKVWPRLRCFGGVYRCILDLFGVDFSSPPLYSNAPAMPKVMKTTVKLLKDKDEVEYLSYFLNQGRFEYMSYESNVCSPRIKIVEFCNDNFTEYTVQVWLSVNFGGVADRKRYLIFQITFENLSL